MFPTISRISWNFAWAFFFCCGFFKLHMDAGPASCHLHKRTIEAVSTTRSLRRGERQLLPNSGFKPPTLPSQIQSALSPPALSICPGANWLYKEIRKFFLVIISSFLTLVIHNSTAHHYDSLKNKGIHTDKWPYKSYMILSVKCQNTFKLQHKHMLAADPVKPKYCVH